MSLQTIAYQFPKFVYLKNCMHLLKDLYGKKKFLGYIKLLYQRTLEQNLMHSPCNLNIDVEWQTLKNTLQQAENEALGKRKKRIHKRPLILWNEDIKNLIENKKAYLRYLTTRSETDKLEYKRLVAIVKRETRKIKGNVGKHLYRELNMI